MAIRKNILLIFIILSLILLTFQNCLNDKEEDLQASICDSTDMTYIDIQPIFEANCYSCHNESFYNKNIKTDSYENLKNAVNSGRLWGAISRQEGFTWMPYNLSKLPDCELGRIKNWIDNDMPQ